MTSILKKAFDEASKLPEIEQNALARWILEELKAERKWEKLLAESEDFLHDLAMEALKEETSGKNTDLTEDRL